MYVDPVYSAPQISIVLSLAKNSVLSWSPEFGELIGKVVKSINSEGRFPGWNLDSTMYLWGGFGQAPYTFVCLCLLICKVGIIIGILQGSYENY